MKLRGICYEFVKCYQFVFLHYNNNKTNDSLVILLLIKSEWETQWRWSWGIFLLSSQIACWQRLTLKVRACMQLYHQFSRNAEKLRRKRQKNPVGAYEISASMSCLQHHYFRDLLYLLVILLNLSIRKRLLKSPARSKAGIWSLITALRLVFFKWTTWTGIYKRSWKNNNNSFKESEIQ